MALPARRRKLLTLDATPDRTEHDAMNSAPPLISSATESRSFAALAVWRAIALALAALIAALAFAAYTQPELLLNYSGLRYCG